MVDACDGFPKCPGELQDRFGFVCVVDGGGASGTMVPRIKSVRSVSCMLP